MEQLSTDSKLFVSSVEKTFLVIDAFSSGQQYLSLNELTELTGMNKSAVQRFTHSLEAIGYLLKDPKTKCYRLTPKVMDIAYNYLRSTPLIEIITPRLVDFRNTFGVTLNVSVLNGNDTVYILRIPSHQQIHTATLVGRRVPAYCSAGGRSILSKLPKEEYERIIHSSELVNRTPYTLTDSKAILRRIKKITQTGFDTNNQECIIGELVIAAPVTNASGQPIAAVHIPVSTRDWTEEKLIDEMSNELLGLVQSIHHP
ncbi:MAG: IclR family transcriptional regulator [Arenicella sp.]